jgi:hypothetical protein
MIRRAFSVPVLAAWSWACSVGVDPGSGTGSPWVTGGSPSDDDPAADESTDEGPSDGSDDGATSAQPADEPHDEGGGLETTGGPLDEGGAPQDDGAEVGGGSEGGPDPLGGDCCVAAMQPGCIDRAVAECVCAQDPFCCETQWDQQCVDSVDALGCGACGGGAPNPGGTEGGDEGGAGGACCAPTGQPGCGDPIVEACICGDVGDVYCCIGEWDEQCAMEVVEYGCAAC